MTNFNYLINSAHNLEHQALRKDSTHAAMNHWFVRNRGVQHKSWQVMYEPTYHLEDLRRPSGLDETYWDTLSQAEKRWADNPVKNQNMLDRRAIWQTQTGMKALRDSRNSKTDFYTQAVQPAEPHDDIATLTAVARGQHLQVVPSSAQDHQVSSTNADGIDSAVIANNVQQLLAEKRQSQLELVSQSDKYPEKKAGQLLQLHSIHPKWKQAGNW